jgi:hypothetical protein
MSFDPKSIATLDEPVRRYLTHAIRPGAALGGRVRLTMSGHIKVGAWLSFSAEQDLWDGHAFEWRARAGLGPLKPFQVTDRYEPRLGSTDGRLFGRLRFLHADDEDTVRASAGRAAVESIFVPTTLLPGPGVGWRTASDAVIVATIEVPPERTELQLTIDRDGALRCVEVQRWGNVGRDGYGYIPFGGDVLAERRFGDLTLPSRLAVGWWYGTPRFAPFFKAEIISAVAND